MIYNMYLASGSCFHACSMAARSPGGAREEDDADDDDDDDEEEDDDDVEEEEEEASQPGRKPERVYQNQKSQ